MYGCTRCQKLSDLDTRGSCDGVSFNMGNGSRIEA